MAAEDVIDDVVEDVAVTIEAPVGGAVSAPSVGSVTFSSPVLVLQFTTKHASVTLSQAAQLFVASKHES